MQVISTSRLGSVLHDHSKRHNPFTSYSASTFINFRSRNVYIVIKHSHQNLRRRWLTTSMSTLFDASTAAAAAHVTACGREPDHVDPVPGASRYFDPCIWGNYFLDYDDPSYVPLTANEAVQREHEKLKEEVKRMIVKIQTTPVTSKLMMPLKDRLRFIDTLQRIGVSFHFDKEIANILQRVHQFDDFSGSDDLYTIATAFRLLRDQGIYVPASIFDKLLDEIVQLDEASASNDVIDGLLALYEASFYAIPDEDILDQAQELTASKLKSILPYLDGSRQVQFEKVEHVLYRSIRMNCERLVARFYISIYKRDLTFGESLLQFAIHDYHIRQADFQKELGALTRWCEELNLKKTIPLSRHRLIEFHFGSLCMFPEPQYIMGRTFFAKFMHIFTMIDDMNDTYGTEEERMLFTEAFARLDPNAFPKLQPHIKAMILATNSFYAEVDQHNPGKPHVVHYLKRECERLIRAFVETARWIDTNTTPTYEEYFDVLMITGGLPSLPCVYLAGMGEIASEDVFSWALDDPIPEYIKVTAIISRLQDDLALGPYEEHMPHTAHRVFMKHYQVSEEEAKKMINQLVKDMLKKKNKGLLKGESDTLGVPRPVLKAIYGETQISDVFNRDQDTYTFPDRLKEFISSIYIDPILI